MRFSGTVINSFDSFIFWSSIRPTLLLHSFRRLKPTKHLSNFPIHQHLRPRLHRILHFAVHSASHHHTRLSSSACYYFLAYLGQPDCKCRYYIHDELQDCESDACWCSFRSSVPKCCASYQHLRVLSSL